MKLLGCPNKEILIEDLLNINIDGIIIYINKLSVNSDYYMNIDDFKKYDFKDKEVFICLNKLMHNSDLPFLEEVLYSVKDMNIRILFYDMSVYNISKRLGIENKLIIYQDHLNASIMSNNFYYDLGIRGSYICNDITYKELLDIKNNSKMDIFFLGYGYQPIFYSRRYLISNYLEYINQEKGNKYKIISDTGVSYPIKEEEYGTTIYTPHEINLINKIDILKDIDYLVLNSVNMNKDKYIDMVLKFINREKIDDNPYSGFFDIESIYKVK